MKKFCTFLISAVMLLTMFFAPSIAKADGVKGTARQESFFVKGQLGTKMLENISIETEGATLATLPNAALNVPVRYNQNKEGKINWNNGTQLIITAKDNITAILIDGDWVQYSSADKGDYVNGAWTGFLNEGESVTFTAGDGINIQSIVILYNGAEYQTEGDSNGNVEIKLNITKKSWATIGAENGEVIGTAELKNTDNFDHFEAVIRCAEDPDQYITFADCMVNGGKLVCYTWTGGHYTLNNGYHYTLTVDAYDVPYYGSKPVATATYDFVGTGAEATKYCDITITNVDLTPSTLLVNGYNYNGDFDVTFSEPVARVQSWWAMGMEGTRRLSATQKSEDGTVWTINLDSVLEGLEGAANIQITAWNADGLQMRGEGGDHSFALNIIVSGGEDAPATSITAIRAAINADEAQIYSMDGAKLNKLQKGINVVRFVNGISKKIMVK